jgi:hypothetical protein
MEAHLIPPDDEPSAEPGSQESISLPTTQPNMTPLTTVLEGDTETDDEPHLIEFDLEHLPLVEDETQAHQDQVAFDNPSAQLLHWHYRLGHVPFKKIQARAHQGRLPKALANCKAPQCAACLYAKATKRAWRTRAPAPNRVTPVQSMDQGTVCPWTS